MVLQQELQDFIFDKINAATKTIEVGVLTGSPTTNTSDLTNVRETKTGSEVTLTILGNILKFETRLEETEANTYTINTIKVTADAYSLDISKHTDISKNNDIIVQYSDQIIHIIE